VTAVPSLLAQLMRWDWVVDNIPDIAAATVEHVQLTVLSVLLGLVLAVPLALLVRRYRGLEGFVSGVAGVLYTIPALAAFALLVPVLGLTSIWTPLIPLASYSLLILLRNTLTGLDGVPDELREAADGMGYRPLRRFVEVELPLALPAVVAGIRVAVVTNVGLVTVTALLGRGGLGALILDGIRRSIAFPTSIIVGTVGAIVLAVVLDLALLAVERAVAPWQRRPA
jgi:osmoprotectant transport system permease protein